MFQLKEDGFTHVDGLDGSAKMLEEAKSRNVYQKYIHCVITAEPMDIEDGKLWTLHYINIMNQLRDTAEVFGSGIDWVCELSEWPRLQPQHEFDFPIGSPAFGPIPCKFHSFTSFSIIIIDQVLLVRDVDTTKKETRWCPFSICKGLIHILIS